MEYKRCFPWIKIFLWSLPWTYKMLNLWFVSSNFLCWHVCKMGQSYPLFLYVGLFNTVDSKIQLKLKFCRWGDSNCGPQVLKATTLPVKFDLLAEDSVTVSITTARSARRSASSTRLKPEKAAQSPRVTTNGSLTSSWSRFPWSN